MAKRLWIVTFSAEVVVAADNKSDAYDVAVQAMRHYDVESEPDSAIGMTYLPAGWGGECIPFGADGDETIDQLIESGAAPEYTKARERLAAAKKATP